MRSRRIDARPSTLAFTLARHNDARLSTLAFAIAPHEHSLPDSDEPASEITGAPESAVILPFRFDRLHVTPVR